ncbi:putative choline dehydrogenase [Xylariomycetidae sp. FL0641]|nr:putative choline dehydrogenase [Xylariomycetidae sp. FL0641]
MMLEHRCLLSFLYPYHHNRNHNHTYDYVVVGGGTAGLTIAARLSEDPKVTVAIIEAGTWAENLTGNQTKVPGYDAVYSGKAFNQTNSSVEWGFHTTPQAGINNQIVHYSRGKALGGSSTNNFMNYAYAPKGALERWTQEVGDHSFHYEAVKHYYQKSMNFFPPSDARFANASVDLQGIHPGEGGPLDVTFSRYTQSWATWVAKAMDAEGLHPTNTFLDGSLFGSSWMPVTISGTIGVRESSETAYLRPVRARHNLAVYDLTLAERLVFNRRKVATGVEVTTGNSHRPYTVRARREVIVSAGTFQSPQLLQVSGVGPAEILKPLGIPVIANRAGVGHGMNDHVLFAIAHRVNLETFTALENTTYMEEARDLFNADMTGPLASTGGDFFGFEKLPGDLRQAFAWSTKKALSQYPKDWPEVQFLAAPAYVGNEEVAGPPSPVRDGMIASILTTLLAPASRGNVRISSRSMRDQPLINPNWLTEQQDIDIVIAAFKRIRQFFASPALKEVLIGDEYYPGNAVRTDEEILAQIKGSFNTMFHASSTCKMGKPHDTYAVVDTQGRVYGVQNLRVVDASIFPFLPPCVPQATIYMLAEKIADDIKRRRWG